MIPRCQEHTTNTIRKKDCIECTRIYYRISSVQERKKLSEFVSKYKLEKGCNYCGYNESSYALEFDHIEPRSNPSKKWKPPKYKKAFLEMTADPNVQVLCANCHKIKTRTNKEDMARTSATNKEGNN